eukprot:CAMPEP_0119368332 /NCGR_PEP_ID=MMETSP1334-20130426/15006_1 /TAXON_ID=127549 /ORGANISM="Calcidiscus leptoporus, Strain RCC1130" /LENGTH=49 /DNA_ID= /DNA_START= /DNA_END= /DNA_ORIENTATION=
MGDRVEKHAVALAPPTHELSSVAFRTLAPSPPASDAHSGGHLPHGLDRL